MRSETSGSDDKFIHVLSSTLQRKVHPTAGNEIPEGKQT